MFTLGTCSYNTPNVTINMIRSFERFHDDFYLITDNSTNDITSDMLWEQLIPHLRHPGMPHSPGVDILFEACITKYMLLVDTDVIFLRSVQPLFEDFKESGVAICGVRQGSRGGFDMYDRICPWFCFIDVEAVKAAGIKFYDPVRFVQHLEQQTNPKIYDVGATFLEDIIKTGLGTMYITEQEQNKYIKHFEGMSWRKDCLHDDLRALGIQTEKEYFEYIKGR